MDKISGVKGNSPESYSQNYFLGEPPEKRRDDEPSIAILVRGNKSDYSFQEDYMYYKINYMHNYNRMKQKMLLKKSLNDEYESPHIYSVYAMYKSL